MNKNEILKEIEKNNNIIFKIQKLNKNKALNLLFENEILSLKLQEV